MTFMMIQSLSLVVVTSLLAVPSQAVRPALLRIQPITTAQKQSHGSTTLLAAEATSTKDFDMVNEDAERSLREMLEYHPETRKLLSYGKGGLSLPIDLSLSIPIDLSLSFPIDLSLSYPMTPPPRIDVDESSDDNDSDGTDDSSDADDATGNEATNNGSSSGAGQGDASTTKNNDFINGAFSTIRSGGAANGLGLGKTGRTGLVLFIVVGGLVVMALIVDQKRRAAAAAAAASMSAGAASSFVAGAYYDDNSTVSGESIAVAGGAGVGGTTDQFV